jgi:peptidoglycan-N-acetylglucosamine deacetylase
MNLQKPIASLSLDLDDKWTYLRTHGDAGWSDFPSFLGTVVPRALDFLAERNLKCTFFIVGQDAALERNHEVLSSIAAAGHEIGNHSFSHTPWLHLYDRETTEKEVASSEEHVGRATGQSTVGFRGPGYSFSETLFEVLAQRGYLYDASTLPTFIGPLARAYYFLHSKLNSRELKDRRLLFGTLRDGLRPLKPYRWQGVLEIPVTTMPFLRFPIHLSYILYLSAFSRAFAVAYFRTALALCNLRGVSPSLLLHPLDFLGKEDGVGLEFFPAMQLRRDDKLALVSRALKIYCESFDVKTLREHASFAAENCPVGTLDYGVPGSASSMRSEME